MATQNEKLQYIVEVVDKASRDLQLIQKEIAGIQGNAKQAALSVSSFGLSFGKMASAVAVGTIAVTAFGKSVQLGLDQIRQSVQAFNQMQGAMIGLSSVASAFGVSQVEAMEAAKKLAQDGLMSINEAGAGLKNLLASGFSLPEAIQLMNAFKDAAAFNRQGTLEFGQAIVGATQGIKNQNSIMVDNVGITKNLTIIMKEQGKSIEDLAYVSTDASVRQALLNGLLQEAAIFSGDAARAAEVLSGQQSQLNTAFFNLQATIGEMLAPATSLLIQTFIDLVNQGNSTLRPMIEGVGKAMSFLAATAVEVGIIIKSAFQGVIEVVVALAKAMEALSRMDFRGVHDSVASGWENLKRVGDEFVASSEKNVSRLGQIWDKIETGAFAKGPETAEKTMNRMANSVDRGARKVGEQVKKLTNDLSKIMADYSKKTIDKTADFQRSLTDLVIRHRDAIRDLKKDISELNAEFEQASKDRLADHEERKGEIIASFEEETKNLRDNLNRRLADNTNSDERLIKLFEAQLAEKEKKRDQELAKEEARFAKEEARQRQSFEKRLAELQNKLNQELEIQRKHQADFDAVKDKAAEDDITRLKNSFAREMEELKRQHDIRMDELRKQQEEILAIKSASTPAQARAIQSGAAGRKLPDQKTLQGPLMSKGNFDPYIRDEKGNPIATKIPKFHFGGIVPGTGEVPIIARGGEAVITPQQLKALLAIKTKPSSMQVNQVNHIYNEVDMSSAIKELGWRLNLR